MPELGPLTAEDVARVFDVPLDLVTPPQVVIPPAVRWCSYAGDVRSTINPLPHGPNEMSEFLTPVEATYDPATNTTRFGWTYQLLTQEQRDAVRARYAA